MSTLVFGNFGAGLSQCQDFPGRLYPKDSVAILRTEDFRGFLKTLLESETITTLHTHPLFGFIDDAIKLSVELDEPEFRLWGDKNLANKTFSEILYQWIEPGPAELCIFRDGDTIAFFGSVKMSADNELVKALFNDQIPAQIKKFMGLSNVLDNPDMIQLEKAGIFLRWSDSFLIVGDDQSLIRNWHPTNRTLSRNTLENDRRFLTVASQLKFDEQADSSVFLYVNFRQLFLGLPDNESGRSLKLALDRIDANEMLAFGSVVRFPVNDPIDLAVDAFLLQGIPKSGVNTLISLVPLESNIAKDAFADSDFYWIAHFDLPKMTTIIGELNELIKLPVSGPPSARTLFGWMSSFSPIFFLLPVLTEDQMNLLNGQWEMFGQVHDENRYVQIDSVSRLRGKPGMEPSLLKVLLELPDPGNRSTHRRFNNVDWLGMKDELIEQEKEKRLKDELERGSKHRKYRTPTASNFRNSLAFYGDQPQFERHVTGEFESLYDDPDFQSAWSEATKNRKPGLFAFFRGVYVFRHTIHWLDRQLFRFAYENDDMKRANLQSPDSFKARATSIANKRVEQDTMEEFKNNLGYGGLAVFNHPNGIELLFFLFRK